ncbi:MAG: SCO family protein [Rhodothermales bacterium]
MKTWRQSVRDSTKSLETASGKSAHSCSGASRLSILRQRTPFLLLVAAALLQACQNNASFEVRGRVVGFADDSVTVFVAHDDVPGFMPAMTMPFRALDPDDLRRFAIGDGITFTLNVAQDSSWIDNVERFDVVGAHDVTPGVTPSGALLTLLPGEIVPPIELEDSRLNSRTLFEGNATDLLVVDFVYTRCPLPEFCPLLSSRFQEMQALLAARGLSRVELLSITVDPEFDTPEVLHAYGRRYGADEGTWTFLTGRSSALDSVYTYLGVSRFPGEEQPIAHPLIVAVIRGDGLILRTWRDTDWTVSELIDAIEGYSIR